jgi:hypothetical protein
MGEIGEMTRVSFRNVPTVVLCILITGCANHIQYQPLLQIPGRKSGYAEMEIESNTWRVIYRGVLAYDYNLIEDLATYRCAELTLEKGYTHFYFISPSMEWAFSDDPTAIIKYIRTTTLDNAPRSAILHDAEKIRRELREKLAKYLPPPMSSSATRHQLGVP